MTSRRGRKLVVSIFLAAAAVCALASLRLAAVVLATPSAFWLVEFAPTLQVGIVVDPATKARANRLASVIRDPQLAMARFPDCEVARADTPARAPTSVVYCANVIDAGLTAAPILGEFWLRKAELIAGQGYEDSSLFEAMRNSYLTAPREGWIAGTRVVLGLRLFRILPDELKKSLIGDLVLVAGDHSLSGTLVQAYIADPAVRATLLDLLDQIPSPQKSTLLESVRAAAGTGS